MFRQLLSSDLVVSKVPPGHQRSSFPPTLQLCCWTADKTDVTPLIRIWRMGVQLLCWTCNCSTTRPQSVGGSNRGTVWQQQALES